MAREKKVPLSMYALSKLNEEFHLFDPRTNIFHDSKMLGPALFRAIVQNA